MFVSGNSCITAQPSVVRQSIRSEAHAFIVAAVAAVYCHHFQWMLFHVQITTRRNLTGSFSGRWDFITFDLGLGTAKLTWLYPSNRLRKSCTRERNACIFSADAFQHVLFDAIETL